MRIITVRIADACKTVLAVSVAAIVVAVVGSNYTGTHVEPVPITVTTPDKAVPLNEKAMRDQAERQSEQMQQARGELERKLREAAKRLEQHP